MRSVDYRRVPEVDLVKAEELLSKLATTKQAHDLGLQLAAALDAARALAQKLTALHGDHPDFEIDSIKPTVDALTTTCIHEAWKDPMTRCPTCGAIAFI